MIIVEYFGLIILSEIKTSERWTEEKVIQFL
jgi:hypothetical protein